MSRRVFLFRDWIREQASIYGVDGCTGVTNWNAHCCLRHDLEFKHGKDAASAYRQYLADDPDPWEKAEPISFEQANEHFKNCNFRENPLGYWNLFAWARYAAMRLKKTRASWNAHREREAAQLPARQPKQKYGKHV